MKMRAAAIAFALLLPASVAGSAELKPGDVLSRDNWEAAKDMLPPEIAKFYQAGDYRNPIMAWPEGLYRHDDAFEAGTEGNRDKYAVNEAGTIIERATGKQPAKIEGLPFPNIELTDPQAGVKVLWNHYYDYWNLGNYHNNTEVTWVGRSGVERQVTQDVYFLYYESQPAKYIPADNPNGLFWQFFANTIAPSDVYGTAALSWRYRDPDKRDALWAYVPALRRVRQVSPSNRSDGFLGSDMSQDDGPFFDGKPEDFTWKLVGEKQMLRYADPLGVKPENAKRIALPEGGWQDAWPAIPQLGFEEPKWQGVPWAPVAAALAQRDTWVLEGVPKDQYYLYGKIQLYLDKGTFNGAWNRKFDWKGELMNSYQVLAYPGTSSPPGAPDEYLWASNMIYRCAYSAKMDRATCPVVRASPTWPSARRIPLKPEFFDTQRLIRSGK